MSRAGSLPDPPVTQMNQDNPYCSPSDAATPLPAVDPKLLHAVAVRLVSARNEPPTVRGVLFAWPGTPLLVLTGVVATVAIGWLASVPGSTFSVENAVAVGAFFLGAAVRDFRFARRAARLWKPQLHFIDWRKVEAYAA